MLGRKHFKRLCIYAITVCILVQQYDCKDPENDSSKSASDDTQKNSKQDDVASGDKTASKQKIDLSDMCILFIFKNLAG